MSSLRERLSAIADNLPSDSEPQFLCKVCCDRGLALVEETDTEGNVRVLGAKPCECIISKRVAKLIARIPQVFKRDGLPRLETLKPKTDLIADETRARFIANIQNAAIAVMKQNPFGSYFFAGPRDSGKTHLAYSLLLHAAEKGRPVWFGTLAELLEEFTRYARGDAGQNGQTFRPSLLPSDLKQNSQIWTVMIDEVAYVRATEFRHEMLFDLVDAAWKNGHQLITTSNQTQSELASKWDALTNGNGDAIVKRIAGYAQRFGFWTDEEIKSR